MKNTKNILIGLSIITAITFTLLVPVGYLVRAEEISSPVIEQPVVETPVVEEAPVVESPVVESPVIDELVPVVEEAAPVEATTPIEEPAPVVEASPVLSTIEEPILAPVLTTDKPDYAPSETATIFGKFFQSLQDIFLKIFGGSTEEGTYTETNDQVTIDEQGSFTYQYQLDNIFRPLYSVVASTVTGEKLAETSFTDKVNTITTLNAIGSPLIAGQANVAFSGTVTKNSGGAPSGNVANVELHYSLDCLQGSFGTVVATVASPDTFSGTFTAPAAGTYYFWAYYVGNSGHNPSSSACQTITVNAAPIKLDQTITFGSLSDKTYGDADFNVSATASSGLTVTFTNSGNCSVTGTLVHITGAGSCTITAHQTGNESYNPAPDVPQSFDIAKADRTCTLATDKTWTRTFDNTPSSTSCSVSAGSGDGSMIFTRNTSSVSTPDNITNASSYAYICQWTGGINYNDCLQQSNTLTINKANQTITFGALGDKTYGNADFSVSATASSGLTVSFGASGNCSMADATTVHITGAGSCTITASQSGNSNYNAAPDVPRTFTINKADATIVVTSYDVTYDGNSHTATGSAIGVFSESLIGLDLTGTTHTDAGDYTGDTWTFTDVTGNYNDDSGTVDDFIGKADATIDVDGYTGVYDGDEHGATGTATGVKGEDLSGSLDLGAKYTNVPGGIAHWTFTGGTNYNDASGDVAININKADATCTIDGYTGVYDATAHGAIGSCTGVGGVSDVLSGLNLGATYTNVSGGIAHWTFTGGTNYEDQSGDVTITINKATLIFKGYLPPISVKLKDFQKMSTIPVKFQLLYSPSGIVIPDSLAQLINPTLTINNVTIGTITPKSSGSSNIGNYFRYDASTDQFIFNLSTKLTPLTTGTYTLSIPIAPSGNFEIVSSIPYFNIIIIK